MSKLELYKDLPTYQELTPQQKVVVDQWDVERTSQHQCFDMMEQAINSKDDALWKQAVDKLNSEACSPSMCEHQRHWSSSCADCDTIDKILCPHLFCKTKGCLLLLEEEDIGKEEFCENHKE